MSSPRLAFACLLVPVWAAAQSAPSARAGRLPPRRRPTPRCVPGRRHAFGGAKALEQLPYQDQLMKSAGGAEAAEGAEPESGGPEPEGFRATVLETRAGRRSNNVGSAGNDLGVFLLHRRETLNYGEILVETAYQSASRADPFGAGTNRSGRLTLSQTGMPLAGGWSLGNSIGLLRSKATSVFAGARRFVLPGVLLEGLGSYLRSPVSGFAAETGRIVRLEGQTGYGLTRTTGRATTVAGSHRIGGSLVTALQLIDVRDSPETGSYTGWSGLVGGRHFSTTCAGACNMSPTAASGSASGPKASTSTAMKPGAVPCGVSIAACPGTRPSCPPANKACGPATTMSTRLATGARAPRSTGPTPW
ncbi:MAG: hypothetical protein R3E48_21445 [Burkholderiaceae bacterium]